jgi:3'-phosphoadenosine 5'-phosphosulfate sulfotransferase (PAPS reductase)/FAD synthetase
MLDQPQQALDFDFEFPRTLATTPDVDALLATNCVVAIGVSGGKDSDACALAVNRYLNGIGHTGPRVLLHADLGRVEWMASLASCERLAAHLGWELIVVQRKAGDLLARWQSRWSANVERYRSLACVRLILPWSTSALRFCTSESKTAPIVSALRKRFPGANILNITGIRRQESSNRSRMPVAAVLPNLQRNTAAGVAWNPIIEWSLRDVLTEVKESGLQLHEAYTRYGASRVSCAYCILSTEADLRAAATCEGNHQVYREMVELEALSTFAFQGKRWLADVAPHLLPSNLRLRIVEAKRRAQERQAIEAEIPAHLLYVDGWPSAVPTHEEADLIASVRRRISDLMELEASYLTRETVQARYAELIVLRNLQAERKLKRNRDKPR